MMTYNSEPNTPIHRNKTTNKKQTLNPTAQRKGKKMSVPSSSSSTKATAQVIDDPSGDTTIERVYCACGAKTCRKYLF